MSIIFKGRGFEMTLAVQGFEVIKGVVQKTLIDEALFEIEQPVQKASQGGIRNAEKKFKSVAKISNLDAIQKVINLHLSAESKLIRAIVFSKGPESNWSVTWHQDKTIALDKKKELKNWGPWSVKDGTIHVQPPLELLKKILTIRVHLDPTDQENGCLRVIPGSHKYGIMSSEKIAQTVQKSSPVYCEAEAGDLLLMKPTILHASSKSQVLAQRRILHLEFSDFQLPTGLSWASGL